MSETINFKPAGGTVFSGIAGEYFVAAELSRRGYIAAVTLRNTPDVDILASNGEKTINIQVKTRRTDKGDGWNFGGKPLESKKFWDDDFYALVEISSIPTEQSVSCFIIPKNVLNEQVEDNFNKWKESKKKNGEQKKSEVRMCIGSQLLPAFSIEQYRERWDSIFENGRLSTPSKAR
jgi:hypothetical protein